MWILAAELELNLPLSRSLKDKRSVRLRIQERIRHTFNVSIIETDLQDRSDVLRLGLALAAAAEPVGQRTIDNIMDRIFELTGLEAEIIGFESFMLGDTLFN